MSDAQRKIPNRFIFVWMGSAFPYHCRLAVESTLLSNPKAQVDIYVYGPLPAVEDFEHCARYERVQVHQVHDIEPLYQGLDEPASAYAQLFEKIPERAASARSNLLRYGLLHTYGGIYLDFDVLVLRDFDDLRIHDAFIGKERVWKDGKRKEAGEKGLDIAASGSAWLASYLLRRTDSQLLGGRDLLEAGARFLEPLWCCYNLNNAVIGATPGSAFIGRVLSQARFQSPTIRFDLGPTLVTKVAAQSDRDVHICDEDTLYPVPPSCSFKFFYGRPAELPQDTRLIHYVASNHKKLLGEIELAHVAEQGRSALFYQVADRVAGDAKSLDLSASTRI